MMSIRSMIPEDHDKYCSSPALEQLIPLVYTRLRFLEMEISRNLRISVFIISLLLISSCFGHQTTQQKSPQPTSSIPSHSEQCNPECVIRGPLHGRDGAAGRDGLPGPAGPPGAPGAPGASGVDLDEL